MISLRLAVPTILVAAAVAGCFTYFVTPPAPVEADQRLPPTAPDVTGPDTGTPTNIDQPPSAEEQAAAAFQAEYEGSIPFTRSSVFNGLRVFLSMRLHRSSSGVT